MAKKKNKEAVLEQAKELIHQPETVENTQFLEDNNVKIVETKIDDSLKVKLCENKRFFSMLLKIETRLRGLKNVSNITPATDTYLFINNENFARVHAKDYIKLEYLYSNNAEAQDALMKYIDNMIVEYGASIY